MASKLGRHATPELHQAKPLPITQASLSMPAAWLSKSPNTLSLSVWAHEMGIKKLPSQVSVETKYVSKGSNIHSFISA